MYNMPECMHARAHLALWGNSVTSIDLSLEELDPRQILATDMQREVQNGAPRASVMALSGASTAQYRCLTTLVRLMDLRPLWMRPDAHVRSSALHANGTFDAGHPPDCLHQCVPGPLSHLVPYVLMSMMANYM